MPRADARRNAAAILAAAQTCLVRDPEATLTEIAQEAGVGRVTLHGHFATRAILVDEVFRQVHAEAEEILAATDTSGDRGRGRGPAAHRELGGRPPVPLGDDGRRARAAGGAGPGAPRQAPGPDGARWSGAGAARGSSAPTSRRPGW